MAEDKLDILFTAPHPDDIEIGCGGTVAKLVQQGYKVGILHMTNGEPTPRGDVETRRQEAEAAAKVLGVAMMEILPLTNRELMDGPEARYAVSTVIRKYRPSVLVGLAGRTPAASPDHYQAQLITEASRFYSQLTKWDDRFAGEPPHRPDHLVYRPMMFAAEHHEYHARFTMDISDTLEQKLEAVACYKSQFDEKRFAGVSHFVSSLAGAEGGIAGYRYGETYALPRPIGTTDMIGMLGEWKIPPPYKRKES